MHIKHTISTDNKLEKHILLLKSNYTEKHMRFMLTPGVNCTIYYPPKATGPRYDSSTWGYLWRRWAV